MMQKSEQALQSANATLKSAMRALEESFEGLNSIESPTSGSISIFLSSRVLLDAQRAVIQNNEEWVLFAKKKILEAREQLQKDTIEYEKFNYLELQEIKDILKKRKIQEAKDLDEIALMTYDRKKLTREAS
jgi:flagellar biosynthesis chaperone FliJ